MPAKPKTAFMPKGYEMNNKLMEEMKKKKVNIASSVQFRNDVLESQKRVNYQNEFDRLHSTKKLSALDPTAKKRMIDLQKEARKSLKGETHIIYSTKF
jgi:phenylalanyl-tRNA synthetase alpha subunit